MSKSKKASKWLMLPPLAVAVFLFLTLVKNKKEPAKVPEKEVSRTLRVITVKKTPVTARAIGFGTAIPGRVWRAVTEVKGRVVEIHDDLKSGGIIQEDTVLLKIDATEYQLAEARLAANIEQVKAQIAELEAQEKNTNTSLEIEERSLKLAMESLERRRKLLEKNAISKDDVDREERSVLVQKQNIQSLNNSLRLIPAQRNSLAANLKVQQVHLEQARLDLKKVVIRAPFRCRLGEVNIQVNQFLAAGQTLFEAHGTAVTEVEAHFPAGALRNLLGTGEHTQALPTDTSSIRKIFNVDALVRLKGNAIDCEWEARLSRIREAVDPQTRTFPVVVAVDEPYEKVIPGKRPPLTKGMFCEVELRSRNSFEAIVIPRDALHGDGVYVVNSDGRLEKRKVTVAFEQADFVCLIGGVEEGATVIVSDATPAVDGMLVAGVVDKQIAEIILAQARGEGNAR